MNSTIFSRFLRALLPAKTKAKHMENGLIFHVTIQIQILTVFSVQSKYSKKTKSISYIRTNSGKYVRGSATQDYRTTYTKQNLRKLTYAYIHISMVHIRICAANDISIRNETSWKFRTAKTIGKTQTDGTWKWALKASFLLLSACSKLVWGVNSFLFGHRAWHMTVVWICHAI